MKIPYQQGSETSREAAEKQKTKAPTAIRKIYDFLLELGEDGATDDEIRTALGLLPSTAGARRRDLELMGGCRKTDRRRETSHGSSAVVYVAIEGATLERKKLGRPRKDKKYSEKITTYLTPEQLSELTVDADGAGLTVSDYVRRLIVRGAKTARASEDLMRAQRLADAFGFLDQIK
tara:strand:+ start:1089 stop:1619 length:531 start_codon:yes stop_codon:yes gene_type:complete